MLRVRIDGDLRKAMREEANQLRLDAEQAIVRVATSVRNELRAQALSARLGRGVSNAWRMRLYRNRGGPAALVYSRAPNIVAAFDEGATIRAKSGRYLAIATGFNRVGGRRGAALLITPEEMARTRGTFVQTSKGGTKLWFLPIQRASRVSQKTGFKRTGVVDAFITVGGQQQRRALSAQRRKLAVKYGAIPMFVLKRQVKLGKRLNVELAAERAAQLLEAEMAREPA